MKDIIRITIDMPVDLHKAMGEAVARTDLSKAQYMRMAIETLNMLSGQNGDLVLRRDGKEYLILIPGVIK